MNSEEKYMTFWKNLDYNCGTIRAIKLNIRLLGLFDQDIRRNEKLI
jgi:hypothetical protein